MLDEHYNNVKALDALNQELFQLQMGEKEMVMEWEACLLRHLLMLVASFPEDSAGSHHQIKAWPFLWCSAQAI